MRFMARIVRLQNLAEIGVRFELDAVTGEEAEGLTKLRLLQAQPEGKEN